MGKKVRGQGARKRWKAKRLAAFLANKMSLPVYVAPPPVEEVQPVKIIDRAGDIVPIDPVKPAALTDAEIKSILLRFFNYNARQVPPRNWEDTIQSHLNWTKNPANEPGSIRARYAAMINYNAQQATLDALRLGVLPSPETLQTLSSLKMVVID
jgi:hypothetical protein